MKSLIRILMLVVTVALLIAGNAMAYPWIEVDGFVDPSSATITDMGNGTSVLEGINYEFIVTYGGPFDAEMTSLSLEFENDVFSDVSTPYGYDPGNWGSFFMNSSDSLYTVSFAGTTIGVGESLSFLVDVAITNAALTDASYWDEGQIWGQSWFAFDNMFGADGGSTSPVPEPATILLIGSGLAGFTAVRRRKLKNG